MTIDIPRPTCGRCCHPVERMIAHWDGMGYIVEAHCHGEREVTRLSLYELADMDAEGLQSGVAFRQMPALMAEVV